MCGFGLQQHYSHGNSIMLPRNSYEHYLYTMYHFLSQYHLAPWQWDDDYGQESFYPEHLNDMLFIDSLVTERHNREVKRQQNTK